MTTKDALDRVARYREENGLPGTLEALTQMRDRYDSLTRHEQMAFNVAFAGFRRLLEPVGGWND